MYSHTLTEKDRWFIDKGTIDSLSRSLFTVGDVVVVCNHKHVMLEEFYTGSCPICKSTVTVPFCRDNVIYSDQNKPRIQLPKPPEERPYVVTRPRVRRNAFEYLADLFPYEETMCLLNRILGWILGILGVVVAGLLIFGVITNDLLLAYINRVVLPKTHIMGAVAQGLLPMEQLLRRAGETLRPLALNNGMVLLGISRVHGSFSIGYDLLIRGFLGYMRQTVFKTRELGGQIAVQTQALIDRIF